MIKIVCVHCNHTFFVPPFLAGKTTYCEGCNQQVGVPSRWEDSANRPDGGQQEEQPENLEQTPAAPGMAPSPSGIRPRSLIREAYFDVGFKPHYRSKAFKKSRAKVMFLRDPGTFSIRQPTHIEDARVTVRADHDSPGSVGLAFLATLLSLPVFFLMLRVLGFAAAPGWLIWYLIIRKMRRKTMTIQLRNAKRCVIDPSRSRMALLATVDEKPRWVAFDVKERFEEACNTVRDIFGPACEEARIKATGDWFSRPHKA